MSSKSSVAASLAMLLISFALGAFSSVVSELSWIALIALVGVLLLTFSAVRQLPPTAPLARNVRGTLLLVSLALGIVSVLAENPLQALAALAAFAAAVTGVLLAPWGREGSHTPLSPWRLLAALGSAGSGLAFLGFLPSLVLNGDAMLAFLDAFWALASLSLGVSYAFELRFLRAASMMALGLLVALTEVESPGPEWWAMPLAASTGIVIILMAVTEYCEWHLAALSLIVLFPMIGVGLGIAAALGGDIADGFLRFLPSCGMVLLFVSLFRGSVRMWHVSSAVFALGVIASSLSIVSSSPLGSLAGALIYAGLYVLLFPRGDDFGSEILGSFRRGWKRLASREPEQPRRTTQKAEPGATAHR